ncbi:MAG: xanthine dehydrogenase family protein subunit M [Deltaproteobacteria bacterium]|nr:xanthine dehydrogenase family protein subunit M [Deltaproteobacteria bacterium]
MSLPQFTFLAPTSLSEACALLEKHQGTIKIKAGGTDMIVRLSHRAVKPDYLMSIKKIPGLDTISYAPDTGLTIGALALLRAVETSPLILENAPMLARAAHATATVQIRNMGTVLGNVCNASPSADNIPTLVAMHAAIVASNGTTEREIPIDEFFLGPGRTSLQANEIAIAIKVPPLAPKSGVSYQKISPRSKVDIAAVNIGALLTLDENEQCQAVRISMGAVGPTPLRAKQAETYLTDRKISDETLAAAGRLAAEDASPISDVRASREYRKLMVEVLTTRALKEAYGFAKN